MDVYVFIIQCRSCTDRFTCVNTGVVPGKHRPQPREQNSLIETSHRPRTNDVGAGAGSSLSDVSVSQRCLHLSEVGSFITVKGRVSVPLLCVWKIQCQTISVRDIPHTQVICTYISSKFIIPSEKYSNAPYHRNYGGCVCSGRNTGLT